MRFFLVVLACVCLAIQTQANDSEGEKLEALSIVEAFEANWAALEVYDVSMVVEKFHMSPLGRSEEEYFEYRLISDMRRGKYCFIFSGSKEVAEFRSGENHIRRGGRAFFYDRETREGWTRNIPGSVSKIRRESVSDCIGLSGFPDVRLVGVYESPRAFNGLNYSLDQIFQGEFHTGMSVKFKESSASTARLTFASPFGIRNLVLVRRFTFDTERFVPIKIIQEVRDGKDSRPRRQESLVWEEKSGIMLPIEVQGERVFSTKVGDKSIPTTEVYDVKYRWHTVNETLPEDLNLEPQLLRDVESMFGMLNYEVVPE